NAAITADVIALDPACARDLWSIERRRGVAERQTREPGATPGVAPRGAIPGFVPATDNAAPAAGHAGGIAVARGPAEATEALGPGLDAGGGIGSAAQTVEHSGVEQAAILQHLAGDRPVDLACQHGVGLVDFAEIGEQQKLFEQHRADAEGVQTIRQATLVPTSQSRGRAGKGRRIAVKPEVDLFQIVLEPPAEENKAWQHRVEFALDAGVGRQNRETAADQRWRILSSTEGRD